MLHTNFGIQNKFAQEVFIFFRNDCHLISVGPRVLNLTQQGLSVGCAVYVWSLRYSALPKQGDLHLPTHWRRAEPRPVRSSLF